MAKLIVDVMSSLGDAQTRRQVWQDQGYHPIGPGIVQADLATWSNYCQTPVGGDLAGGGSSPVFVVLMTG